MGGRFSPWYHERLTARLAGRLAGEGCGEVRASARGYAPAEAVRGASGRGCQTPDVTAWADGRLRVFEVETLDTLDDYHTREQWTVLSAFAREAGAEFCVVVPKGLRSAAERALRRFRLEAAVRELSLLP